MKKVLLLTLFLVLACDHQWDNLLNTDEDLKNKPNILQINLDSDNNAAIILDYAYSDSSNLVLERKSIGGFESISYIRKSQTTLVDTSFDKEINHTFVYRVCVKKDKYRSSYSDEKQLIYTSAGLNKPQDVLAISVELQGIRLEWKDRSNYEESYKIEKNEGSGFVELATLSSNAESYLDVISGIPQIPLQLQYRIKAFKSDIESGWASISTSYAGIGSPTNLRITSGSYSKIKIAWDDNSNIETFYAIERKKDNGNFEFIDSVAANVSSYSDNVAALGTYFYRVCAVKDGQYSPYSNEISSVVVSLLPPIPTDGLIAYWPFNGNANDESGNNNGTVNGATLTTDRFGNDISAYAFDGVDDYIDIGNNLKPNLPVSISLWVMSNGNISGLFCNDEVNPSAYYNGIWLAGNCQVGIGSGYASANTRKALYTTLQYFEDIGTWHHLVGIVNTANDMHIFIDGVECDGSLGGNGNTVTYSSSSGKIGKWTAGGATKGLIDDIRVYNKVLTGEEIQALYYEASK